MSTPVGPATSAAQIAALLLQQGAGGAANLTLGQVVQARVIRQLEPGRYLVMAAGLERVVESAQPLRSDELITVRVAGSRDQIEFERIDRQTPSKAADAEPDSSAQVRLTLGGGAAAAVIEGLFRRFRGTLNADDAESLKRLVARAGRPEQMALAGLVLNKVSLPVVPELAQEIYEALSQGPGVLTPIPQPTDLPARTPAWWPLGQRVLNAQGGGAIAHRVGTVAVEFGDTVLEVDIALFEQQGSVQDREAQKGAKSIQQRKLVLSMETESLGRVEIGAVTADNHIRVGLVTESTQSTNALLRNSETLADMLASAGWQVDEISHETRPNFAVNGAVSAAIDHIVAPGSVDRLI